MNFLISDFQNLSVNQLYEILQLRSKVFVVEQNCVYLDCDDKDIASDHVMLYNNEFQLIAYARILPKGISYPDYCSIGRVATHPEYRAQTLGKKLMDHVVNYCDEKFDAIPIKISAQSYLINFYKKYGFEVYGDEYIEDQIPHTAMIRSRVMN